MGRPKRLNGATDAGARAAATRPKLLLTMEANLHSPQRRLIELRMEHADLDHLIDRQSDQPSPDDLALRRMKKRRLLLRDLMARLEMQLLRPEPA